MGKSRHRGAQCCSGREDLLRGSLGLVRVVYVVGGVGKPETRWCRPVMQLAVVERRRGGRRLWLARPGPYPSELASALA